MNDRHFPSAFVGSAAVAPARPLSELLERRPTSSAPSWLGGPALTTAPRAPVAVAEAEPEPEPDPEPAVAAEPPPPPAPDPEVTARMAQAIERFTELEAQLAEEPDVVELAMIVAQTILQRELETRPELVMEAVQLGLADLRGEAPTKVRVHPTMLEALTSARPDLAADGVELVADPTLGVGGCIVESAHRALDASVEERLERFRGAFAAALASGEG